MHETRGDHGMIATLTDVSQGADGVFGDVGREARLESMGIVGENAAAAADGDEGVGDDVGVLA